MQTGENVVELRKIIDLIRKCSILALVLHFYIDFYAAFRLWHLTHPVLESVLERMLAGLLDPWVFEWFYVSKLKLVALGLLCISLVGTRGAKDEKMSGRRIAVILFSGLALYWGSRWLVFDVFGGNARLPFTVTVLVGCYIGLTSIGYLLILRGGTLLSRVIRNKLVNDVFNSMQETFPQEERLLDSDVSINLPAVYTLKGKLRKSWINFINPFRGILVAGTPGSGKSYFVIRHIITQHIKKGFTMFVYDFKFDDLSLIVYNCFLKYKHKYAVEPKFYLINFDDLSLSHRCNPLDPGTMTDITDAVEAARTIMMGLNRGWIRKAGDFFVESPINFVTAVIWFLRKYKDGKYCTLPHVIEMMQMEYGKLFSVLRTEPQIAVLVNPFVTAYTNRAMEQLEGQVGSAKIALARLSSPKLYYVLSGSDFTLDLNNPREPKIVCMANNYMKQGIYGAVLSLYTSRMIKLVNRKDQLKSSLIFDEFPTIYFNGIDSLLATARSNQVATTICVQDFAQLRKDYGKEQADAITSVMGNLIAGQVTGDTAKSLSERFGRILQDRQSFSVHGTDTSSSRSTQLEAAIPASTIATLSSGEMVGAVGDDPDQKIRHKIFHSEIQNDHAALKKQKEAFKPIPAVRKVEDSDVESNYRRIKEEVLTIIGTEMDRIYDDPTLAYLLVGQKKYTGGSGGSGYTE